MLILYIVTRVMIVLATQQNRTSIIFALTCALCSILLTVQILYSLQVKLCIDTRSTHIVQALLLLFFQLDTKYG